MIWNTKLTFNIMNEWIVDNKSDWQAVTYHCTYIAINALHIYIYVLTVNLFYRVLHANFEHSTDYPLVLRICTLFDDIWQHGIHIRPVLSVRRVEPTFASESLNQSRSCSGVATHNNVQRACLRISVRSAMYTQLLKPPHVPRHRITICRTIRQACSWYNRRRGDAGVWACHALIVDRAVEAEQLRMLTFAYTCNAHRRFIEKSLHNVWVTKRPDAYNLYYTCPRCSKNLPLASRPFDDT